MAYQIIILLFTVILQQTGLVNILGVRPNIILAVISPLSFFIKDKLIFIILAIIATLFLKTVPIWDWSALIFLVAVLAADFIKDRLPWQASFSNLLLIVSITIIISFPHISFLEIIYNTVLGLFIFMVYRWLNYEKV